MCVLAHYAPTPQNGNPVTAALAYPLSALFKKRVGPGFQHALRAAEGMPARPTAALPDRARAQPAREFRRAVPAMAARADDAGIIGLAGGWVRRKMGEQILHQRTPCWRLAARRCRISAAVSARDGFGRSLIIRPRQRP